MTTTRPAYEWLILYGLLDRQWELSILRFQRCQEAFVRAHDAERCPRPLPALMYVKLARGLEREEFSITWQLLLPLTAEDALATFPDRDYTESVCWSVRDWFFELEPAVDEAMARFRPYVPLPPQWSSHLIA